MVQQTYTDPLKARNTIPNRPLVLSIPPSGKRSLLTCIYGPDYDDWSKDRVEQRMFMHVGSRNHTQFRGINPDRFIVSPLRNPKNMWASWVKRVHNNDWEHGIMNGSAPYGVRRGPGPKRHVRNWAMAADVGMHPLDMFEDQWRNLQCYDREYEIFYVPIDLPCAKQKIRQLSKILDKLYGK